MFLCIIAVAEGTALSSVQRWVSVGRTFQLVSAMKLVAHSKALFRR